MEASFQMSGNFDRELKKPVDEGVREEKRKQSG